MGFGKNISAAEKKVFGIHLLFSVIQGVITGVFALNEYVLIKDMSASNYQMSVLFQSAALVFLFSIFVNEFLKRISDKRKMLRIAALVTHLPLVLIAFYPRDAAEYAGHDYYIYLFLLIFFLFYLNTIIVLPTINQMLKGAYSHDNFGKLFSYSSSINKVVIMLTTIAFGIMLDKNNYIFVNVYPLLAALGIFSVVLLSRIPYDGGIVEKQSIQKSLKTALLNAIEILKNNKAYLHFEMGFMFYGFAWMLTTAVATVYFNEVFGMNHATYGFYKNGYNLLAIILLPFFGKLIGKIDPRYFGALTFGALMLYTLSLAVAQYFPGYYAWGQIKIYYSLLTAYTFYGVFAATMALLWFIGSAYFCKKEEAAQYQSIHLTLTGIRSLFSFQAGIALYRSLGYTLAFGIASASLLIAVLLMIWSGRKYQNI